MSKKYLVPVIFFVGFALLLLILPPHKSYTEINPVDLLAQVNSPSRFVTTHEVAERIIENDPSLVLVDVRSQDEYLDYTIPGAINIPLEDFNNPDQLDILRQEGMDFIYFSNGSIRADQAWIFGRRSGLENTYIMKGGLNLWFENFFMVTAPPETAPAKELEEYQFRLGVRQFFTGGDSQPVPQSAGEPVQVQTKTKKSAAEGGC